MFYKKDTILEYKGNKCILKKYAKTGSTFIEKEMLPEDTQIVYRMEYWYIEYEDKNLRSPLSPIPFKYIDYIGIKSSTFDEDDSYEEPNSKIIEDKFISIHGIEIY